MTELTFSQTAPRVRKSFAKIRSIVDIPDLIKIQKQSFERFLQTEVEPEKRENAGLQAVFNSIFPIKEGVPRDEAEEIKKKIEEAGGQADIK